MSRPRRAITPQAVLALAVLLGRTAAPGEAGPETLPSGAVRGSITIAGQKSTPTHVYAVRDRGGFAGTGEVQLYFRTSPATGWGASGVLEGPGPCLSAWLAADGRLLEAFYHPDAERGHLEFTGPGHVFEKIVFDASNVSGRLRSEGVLTGFGGTTYAVDVSFKAPVVPKGVAK